MGLPDWSQLDHREHFVQFYAEDAHLEECVASFFAAGLRAGEAVVIAGTPAHREGVERRLQHDGWDLRALEIEGRYMALDAADTLRRFMVNGWPHPDLCMEVLGEHLVRAQGRGRRVRVFGEMVAVLWQQGHREAALRLEELWNRLGEILPFTLYCAYHGEVDERICCAHSSVVTRLGSVEPELAH